MYKWDWVNSRSMYAVSNYELLTFLLINKLSCKLWEIDDSNDMIWARCDQDSLVRSCFQIVYDSTMSSQTHNMFSFIQVKDFEDSCFLLGTGSYEIISYKLKPKTSEALWIKFIDKLLWDLTYLSVPKEFIEIFGGLLSFLNLSINILAKVSIEITRIILFFLEDVDGNAAIFLNKLSSWSFAEVDLHFKKSFIFLMIIPKKIVVNIGDETFIEDRLIGLIIIVFVCV